MHNLSVTQAVTVWSEFEQALHGTNGFGGNTAEIYAYSVMPHTPTHTAAIESGSNTGLAFNCAEDSWLGAANSLYALLKFFVERHGGEEKIEAIIDGVTPDKWHNTIGHFNHRAHVTITRRDQS